MRKGMPDVRAGVLTQADLDRLKMGTTIADAHVLRIRATVEALAAATARAEGLERNLASCEAAFARWKAETAKDAAALEDMRVQRDVRQRYGDRMKDERDEALRRVAELEGPDGHASFTLVVRRAESAEARVRDLEEELAHERGGRIDEASIRDYLYDQKLPSTGRIAETVQAAVEALKVQKASCCSDNELRAEKAVAAVAELRGALEKVLKNRVADDGGACSCGECSQCVAGEALASTSLGANWKSPEQYEEVVKDNESLRRALADVQAGLWVRDPSHLVMIRQLAANALAKPHPGEGYRSPAEYEALEKGWALECSKQTARTFEAENQRDAIEQLAEKLATAADPVLDLVYKFIQGDSAAPTLQALEDALSSFNAYREAK